MSYTQVETFQSISMGYTSVHSEFHWPFLPGRSVYSSVLFFPTNNFLDGLVEFCEHSWHDNIKIESTSKAWLRPFRIKSIKVWAKTVCSKFQESPKVKDFLYLISYMKFWGYRWIALGYTATILRKLGSGKRWSTLFIILKFRWKLDNQNQARERHSNRLW